MSPPSCRHKLVAQARKATRAALSTRPAAGTPPPRAPRAAASPAARGPAAPKPHPTPTPAPKLGLRKGENATAAQKPAGKPTKGAASETKFHRGGRRSRAGPLVP